MNRRRFIISTAAMAATPVNRIFAERGSRSISILTSELTGGKVDTAGTTLEMVNHHIDKADGSEHVHFAIENDGQFDIYFWPHASGDSREFIEWYSDTFMSVALEPEALVADNFQDGGFVGFRAFKIGYYEYQRDAYPGHDLLALFYADAEVFEKNFADAQSVLIDGVPPFIFHEEADILTVAAGQIESTETATITRTSRGSRSTSTVENTAPTPASGSEIEAVIAMREKFWSSYDELTAFLDVAAATGSTEKEVTDSWVQMNAIATGWIDYPTEAAAITFPRDLVSLETAFIDWADSVAVVGTTFLGLVVQAKTTDDFAEAHDAMVELDKVLGDELEKMNAGSYEMGYRRRNLCDPQQVYAASGAPITMFQG